jgi:hypothetical protein
MEVTNKNWLNDFSPLIQQQVKENDKVLVVGEKSVEYQNNNAPVEDFYLLFYADNRFDVIIFKDKTFVKQLSERKYFFQEYLTSLKFGGKIVFDMKGLKKKKIDKMMKNISLPELKLIAKTETLTNENSNLTIENLTIESPKNSKKETFDLSIIAEKIKLSRFVKLLVGKDFVKEGDTVLVLGGENDNINTISLLNDRKVKVTVIKTEPEKIEDLDLKETFKAVIGTYTCSSITPEFIQSVLEKHAERVVSGGKFIAHFVKAKELLVDIKETTKFISPRKFNLVGINAKVFCEERIWGMTFMLEKK